jgi:glyoxylase-like metal-dependent hydrolase (beta-lactamase superfamily II)
VQASLTGVAGRLEVVALLDASGPFTLTSDRESAFPDATSDDWDAARRLDPGAFGPGGAWILDFRCYAIRRPGGRVTLVDTGVGPADAPASTWAPVPGRLPEALVDAGIGTSDVDTVVLTHLHADHCGWSVGLDGRPTFPGARHVLQQAEVVAAAGGTVAESVVGPLRRAGQLDVVDGRVRIHHHHRDSVTVVPTPGHTAGHQSVVIEGDGDDIVVTGDVLVHAVQLAAPDVAYAFEDDKGRARATRRELLAWAGHRQALLATSHLARPFLDAGGR